MWFILGEKEVSALPVYPGVLTVLAVLGIFLSGDSYVSEYQESEDYVGTGGPARRVCPTVKRVVDGAGCVQQ